MERVTTNFFVPGLDPAGPNFYDVDGELQISPTSGDFVDIIHTNGGSLLGVRKPVLQLIAL